MTPPFFSVVVPTCDRPELLATCLERLAPGRQALAADRYEVIVTDDGAAIAARPLIAETFPWARWTQGPRRGPAANRNHGASQARGEWLVFTDDDCRPSPEWLGAFAGTVARMPAVRVIEGRTLATGPRRSIDTDAPINTHGGYLWSCNFAIRRDLFGELGGFDEAFLSATMEDVDLARRLRQRAVDWPFAAEALVHHPWRRRKGAGQVRAYVRSVDYFVAQHPDQAGFFTVRRALRILIATTLRLGWAGVKNCRGRGIARMMWLEFYTFVLLARSARRRAPALNDHPMKPPTGRPR